MSFYSPINRETLASAGTLQIDRRNFPTLEANLGDLVKITGSDGAVKVFRVAKASAMEFLLRPVPGDES